MDVDLVQAVQVQQQQQPQQVQGDAADWFQQEQQQEFPEAAAPSAADWFNQPQQDAAAAADWFNQAAAEHHQPLQQQQQEQAPSQQEGLGDYFGAQAAAAPPAEAPAAPAQPIQQASADPTTPDTPEVSSAAAQLFPTTAPQHQQEPLADASSFFEQLSPPADAGLSPPPSQGGALGPRPDSPADSMMAQPPSVADLQRRSPTASYFSGEPVSSHYICHAMYDMLLTYFLLRTLIALLAPLATRWPAKCRSSTGHPSHRPYRRERNCRYGLFSSPKSISISASLFRL